jgi:hypothetical protein
MGVGENIEPPVMHDASPDRWRKSVIRSPAHEIAEEISQSGSRLGAGEMEMGEEIHVEERDSTGSGLRPNR